MPTPFEKFILLSVQLCGISRFDLLGTGYANRYFLTIESIVGESSFNRLLDTFATLPTQPTEFHAALNDAIRRAP
jgi:hypothetical protein